MKPLLNKYSSDAKKRLDIIEQEMGLWFAHLCTTTAWMIIFGKGWYAPYCGVLGVAGICYIVNNWQIIVTKKYLRRR